MKKVLLSSAIVAALIFTGCSSKDPSIDATNDANSAQNADANMNTETVSGTDIIVDENGIASGDSNELSMSGLESQMQSVHFDFDQFALTTAMGDKVDANAELATTQADSYMVKVEGNCDEWGSDEYNYALGLKRANSVKSALIEKGVSAERISMVSYGESNPVCSDKTKACWAENRRVDFKLLP
ncbi:MAG: OmpA family protein [Campylobacterota bacterium]|nr:OmpA family protein [Campylobacterota bacterium]